MPTTTFILMFVGSELKPRGIPGECLAGIRRAVRDLSLIAACLSFLSGAGAFAQNVPLPPNPIPGLQPAKPQNAQPKFAPPQIAPPRIVQQTVQRGQSMQVTINNGQRQLTMKRDGEVIEMKDTNGKNISIRHTRQVDGKDVTETYEAQDLPTLEKKHPAGAKLYKEIGGNIQVQMQANPNIMNGIRPRVVGDLSAPPPMNRQIRAQVGEYRVEIREQQGQPLQISYRSRKEPQAAPVEISAANLTELREKSPVAASLYEQLSGLR